MKNINENVFSFRYSKATMQPFLPMDKQGKEISRSRINNQNLLFSDVENLLQCKELIHQARHNAGLYLEHLK
jgi:hypothetical protein